MATVLYLRNTTTNGITTTGDGVLYDMKTTAGAGVDVDTVTLTDGGTAIQWTQSAGGSTIAWISGRVPSGGFTLTTSDISVWLLESNMNDEAVGRYRLFKFTPPSTVVELGGGPFTDNAEMPTTVGEMTWAGNVTDTAFAENDRLLLRLYASNFTTMTAGTAQVHFNAAAAATGDSFLNIAETVAFKAESVSVALSADFNATGAIGSFGKAVSKALSTTGFAGTGAIGTLSPYTSYSAALQGFEATGAIGSFGKAIALGLSGKEATGQSGLLRPNLSVAISGKEATGNTGTLGTYVAYNVALVGKEATGSIGDLSLSIAKALSGFSLTGALGTLTPESSGAPATVTYSGVSKYKILSISVQAADNISGNSITYSQEGPA